MMIVTEYRFFEQGTIPVVSTYGFHRDRDRAQHLEQSSHHERLVQAVRYVADAYTRLHRDTATLSDLGCGDGGLLSQIGHWPYLRSWGYDFTPANVAGARERGVAVNQLDVFNAERDKALLGDITVMTEVLEHLADPHGVLRWVAETSRFLVASSPWDEHADSHDECHAWAWDVPGYRALLERNGWEILQHEKLAYKFQVVLAERKME